MEMTMRYRIRLAHHSCIAHQHIVILGSALAKSQTLPCWMPGICINAVLSWCDDSAVLQWHAMQRDILGPRTDAFLQL